MLAAAGVLESTRPTGSVAAELKVIEINNTGAEAQRMIAAARSSRARSVYLPLVRTLVPTALEVFDFADQGLVTGSRETTTVPTQALYLLNDPFVRRNSLSLAESLLTSDDTDDHMRVRTAYLSILGRAPSPTEVERAQFYLSDYQAEAARSMATEFAMVARREREARALAQRPADAMNPVNDDRPKSNGKRPRETQQVGGQTVTPDNERQDDAAANDDMIQPRDARSAAWASFVQALFGSGEFRYVK